MASRNAETFRALHQAFNRRDFDSVVGVMAEDVVYHDRARDVSFQRTRRVSRVHAGLGSGVLECRGL